MVGVVRCCRACAGKLGVIMADLGMQPPSNAYVSADALTEVFWAALHGLVTLTRTGRLRPADDSERLQLLVSQCTNRRETMR